MSTVRRLPWYEMLIGVGTLFGGFAIAVTLLESQPSDKPRRELQVPFRPVSIDAAAIKGSDRAPVVLIEYTDFECPFCAAFARNTLPGIVGRYVESGKVLLALRHRPLNIHLHARAAAEAVVCAGRQGKVWEMHDLVFKNQKRLDAEALGLLAEELDIDRATFLTCLNGEGGDQVDADVAEADELSINSTPSFLVGIRQGDNTVLVKRVLSGNLPIASFAEAIDGVLASK